MNRKIKDKERADKGKHLSAFLTHKKRSIAVITAAVLTVSTIAAGIPSLAGEADAAQKTEPKTASQTVDAKTAVQKEDGALDLRDYITDVDVRVEENGKWVESDTVEPGQKASFDVSYTIPGNTIDDVRKLVYDIDDEHLDIGTEQSGKVTETAPEEAASRDAEEKQENKGTYKVDTDDSVTIDLNKDTDISKEQKGSFNIEGTVKNVEDTEDAADAAKSGKAEKSEKAEAPDESEIVFNDDVTVPVTEPEQSKEAADSGKAAETQTADKQDDVENTEKTDSTDSTAADSKVEDKDSSQAVPESGDAAEAEKKVEDQNPDAQQAENAGEAEKADQEAEKKDASLTDKIIDKVKGGIDVFKTNPVISYRDADAGYSVQLIYNENSGIKERTTLSVKEITDKADHEKYLNRSREGIEVKDGHRLEGRFFDISLLDKDGNEYEPEGPVDVRIIYDKKIEKAKGGFKAVHFAKPEKAGAEDVDLEDTSLELPEITGTDPEDRSVQFETESFSVYGVVYTVDFALEAGTYSLKGGDSIKLSDLMKELKIEDFDIDDVDNVTFDDETLVKVKKDLLGSDWTLKSLKPFKTTQKLTIEMNDGKKYEITVTDAQDFGKYVDSISVAKNTKDDGTGTWVPVPDNTLTNNDYGRITIDFNIPADFVSDDNTLMMTYEGADVFVPEGGTSGTAFLDGKPAGTYSISADGTITVTIDPDIIDSTKPFKGEISFEGVAKNTSENDNKTVKFNDDNIITVKPSEKPKDYDMSVEKTSGTPVEENGTKYIYYTVKISTEKGTKGGNISLSDKLSGNGVDAEYDFGKQFTIIKHSANGDTSRVNASTPSKNSDGSYNLGSLPELKAGEYYTIQYAVKVGTDISSADGYSDVYNSFNAKDEKNNKSDDNDVKITSQFLQKTVQTDPNDPSKLLWTITINPDKQKLTSDVSIKDVITTSDGEKIELPKNFTYTTNGSNPQQGTFGEDGSFTFGGSNGTTNTYVVTYSTDAPKPAEGKSATVTNTVTDNKNHTGTASTGVTTPVTSYDLEKKLSRTADLGGTKKELSWESTIALPKSGEVDTTKIGYTDTFVTMNSDESVDGKHYSTAKKLSDSLQITYTDEKGATHTLEAGTDYRLYSLDGKVLDTTDDTTEINGFKVKFRDTDTVKNATKNAKDGFHLSYKSIADYGDVNPGETWNFINKAKMPSHETSSQWDYKKPSGSMDKESSGTGKADDNSKENTYWSNGVKVNYESGKNNIIYYRVFITPDWSKGGDITLTDTLPAGVTLISGMDSKNNNRNYNRIEYFENNTQYYDLSQYGKKYSFNQGDMNEDGTTPLTIKIIDGWQNGGRNTGKLAIYYAVKIDDDYWNDPAHTKKLYKNTITWGQLHDTQTTEVDHNLKVLTKTGEQEFLKNGNSDYTGDDGKKVTNAVNYYIDINPQGLDLVSGSDTLNLIDAMTTDQNDSKVTIDPASIQLYTYDEKADHHLGTKISADRYTFSYDDATDQLKMTIPDGLACVLTYKYSVDMGLNAPTLTNKVSIAGRSQDSIEHKEHTEKSSSYSSLFQKVLTVKKVDKDNYSMGLPNVTFQLEKFNSTTKQWEKVIDQIKTGEDGNVKLDSHAGIKDFPAENVLYRIQEINNPDTRYQINNDYHYFMWKTKASQTDGDAYGAASGGNQWYHPGLNVEPNQIQFLVGNGSIFVPNENVTVNVHKVWLDKDGKEITDKSDLTAKVQLRRHSGQIEKCIVKVQTSKDNNTEVWGTYEVKPGSTMYITAQTNNPGVTFTYNNNNYTSKRITEDQTLSSVTIPVTVTGNMLINITRNGDYNSGSQNISYEKPDAFKEVSDERVGRPVELNASNNWSHSWDRDLSKQDADGNEYYYYVEEVSGNKKYDVTYSENNSFGIKEGTITVTNREKNIPKTSFEFTKKWKNSEGSDVSEWKKDIVVTLSGKTNDSEIANKFTIYKNDAGTFTATKSNLLLKDEIPTYTFTASEEYGVYKFTFTDLPKQDDNGNEYTYSLTEEADGYTPSYSDGTNTNGSITTGGTVTNTEKPSGTVLPSAGGKGILALLLTGGVLAAGSAAYLLFRRRRRPSEK